MDDTSATAISAINRWTASTVSIPNVAISRGSRAGSATATTSAEKPTSPALSTSAAPDRRPVARSRPR